MAPLPGTLTSWDQEESLAVDVRPEDSQLGEIANTLIRIRDRNPSKESRVSHATVSTSAESSPEDEVKKKKPGKRFVLQGRKKKEKEKPQAEEEEKNIKERRGSFILQREAFSKAALETSSSEHKAMQDYLIALFEKFDPMEDGTGSIDADRMLQLLQSEKMNLFDLRDVQQLIRQLDLDGSGTIEVDEFPFFFTKAEERIRLKKAWFGVSSTAKRQMMNNRWFLRVLFREFDSHGNGQLNKQDLFELSKFLDMGLSKSEVEILQTQMDLDGNGTIEENELMDFFNEVKSREELTKQMKSVAAGENNSQFIETIFRKFDMKKTGMLKAQDLLNIIIFLKLDFSRKSVYTLLSAIDTDGNGTIELEEFMSFFSQVQQWSDLRKLLEEFDQSSKRMTRIFRAILGVSILGMIVCFILALAKKGEGPFLTVGILCLCLSIAVGLAFVGVVRILKVMEFLFCNCSWKKFLLWETFFVVISAMLIVMMLTGTSGVMVPLILFGVVAVFLALILLAKYFQNDDAVRHQVSKAAPEKPAEEKPTNTRSIEYPPSPRRDSGLTRDAVKRKASYWLPPPLT